MSKWMAKDVKINDVKIHYHHTGGDKPPFVLLHGLTDNGLCFTPITDMFAKDYDVFMPDAQGHGLSDRADDNFRFLNYIDQLIGFIHFLNIEKPVIMGHSMGGAVAAAALAKNPLLAKAIILEDPAWTIGVSSDKENEENGVGALVHVWIKMLQMQTRGEVLNSCQRDNPLWDKHELAPWTDSKFQVDLNIFHAMPFDLPPFEEVIPKITCPILLITANPALGGVLPQKIAKKASELWTTTHQSRWVYLEDSGHNIRREHFSFFCKEISRFLKENS